jgi:hypothetical protein
MMTGRILSTFLKPQRKTLEGVSIRLHGPEQHKQSLIIVSLKPFKPAAHRSSRKPKRNLYPSSFAVLGNLPPRAANQDASCALRLTF